MKLNKKVTAEQMKGYESTLTQDQGEAQLREDARTSFTKAMLEGQAKQKRSELKWSLLYITLDLIVVSLLINCLINN